MDGWAIDAYGLRAAAEQSVLGQLEDHASLHISPLTWHPAKDARRTAAGSISHIRLRSASPTQLALVDGGVRRVRESPASFDAQLVDLHNKGVLLVAGDHECDHQRVVEVEGSWPSAGLVWRPTNETIAAVMTAERLGLELITEDSDARKLANYWNVRPMTVIEFASSLAA